MVDWENFFIAVTVFGVVLGWAVGSAFSMSGYHVFGAIELSVICLLSLLLNFMFMIRLDQFKKMRVDNLEDSVADYLHDLWMRWSKAIADEEDISSERMQRWEQECWMPFEELSEDMKDKDRKYARELLQKVKGDQDGK